MSTTITLADLDSDDEPEANGRTRAGRGGPKSAAGKATAARNATTHGVFSAQAVLPGVETQEDWDRYRARIRIAIAPDDTLEEALADHLALLFWRRQRLSRSTAAPAPATGPPADDEAALDRSLSRILRYDTHLTRQINATLDRIAVLKRRQAADPFRHLGRPPRGYAPVFDDPAAKSWNDGS